MKSRSRKSKRIKKIEDNLNALMKIRSMVFNLAQEHRLNAAELDDFNDALAISFSNINELKNTINTLATSTELAEKHRNKWIEKYETMKLIGRLTGITETGIRELESYPLDFLKSIYNASQKHHFMLEKESDFWAIKMKFTWLCGRIEDDQQALKSARFFKKLYATAPPNSKQRQLALQIMKQIADQHPHILNDFQKGKRFHEIQNKITNHWYAQLSTHNPAQ